MARSANVIVEKMPGEAEGSILRRFNRAMQEGGLASEISRRARFEKPSDKRRHHLQKVRRQMKLKQDEEMGIVPRQKKKKRKEKQKERRDDGAVREGNSLRSSD